MKNLLAVIAVLVGGFGIAQNTNMGDPGYPQSNPVPCLTFSNGSTPNFFDDQGAGGNYSPNYNDTITFCPDLTQGTKMTLTWGINAGFSFGVDGSDSIYVYDGPDVNSPLLGVHNSVTDPTGFAYTASWNNPSGCLTVVFISDGAVEGTGWEANASCGDVNQPFEMHIEAFVMGTGPDALDPADTGYVDICFGDSIMFVAKPLFPYSWETTGYGYSQNVDNVTYDWYISDGGTYPDNDTIWFTPPARNGYLVDLKITDQFPQSERMMCKVRVSQLPSFAGTGPLEDTVCLGQNTVLIGGVTQTDTVGIDIPPGTFELGGSFAGLTYLPDGSGAQYQAPIDIGGFPAGATIQNSQDLNQVCITMEHSYLGDLEIALECPNGTQVTLLNSYNPGFIPGGFGGGGTFLGDADDNSGNGVPGVGWEYCFSSVFNTWGDMPTEFAAGNTINAPISNGQSMNPNGVYLPEDDFSTFAGCPINGQWTIIVQDNLTIDDGYIFEWGLFFDPSFFPGLDGYQNIVVSENWVNDPTIVSGQNDTLLIVQPDTPGQYGYTYEITDDFGCDYDTTVFLEVLPLPEIQADTIGCNLGVQLQGTSSYNGGVWTVADTAVHFQPDEFAENPLVYTTVPGTYTLTYTDNACGQDTTLQVEFPTYVWAHLYDTTLCQGVELQLTALAEPSVTNFDWNTGESGETIIVSQPGSYVVTVSNICHTGTATANIEYKLCDIEAPNIISLSSTAGNQTWFVEAEGLATFHCTIVNRWGNVIYEFDDPNGSWDGTSNGTKVAEGTYYYVINATIEGGEELNKHGFIQVVH
jgi:gliding motility-associated-like protein